MWKITPPPLSRRISHLYFSFNLTLHWLYPTAVYPTFNWTLPLGLSWRWSTQVKYISYRGMILGLSVKNRPFFRSAHLYLSSHPAFILDRRKKCQRTRDYNNLGEKMSSKWKFIKTQQISIDIQTFVCQGLSHLVVFTKDGFGSSDREGKSSQSCQLTASESLPMASNSNMAWQERGKSANISLDLLFAIYKWSLTTQKLQLTWKSVWKSH